MSQIVTNRIDDILGKISTITRKLNWPDLPIDLKPPIGDFALVCFPAAKILKQDPSDIATKIALEINDIKEIISAKPEKGYCNVVIDWNDITIDVINEINDDSYAKTKEDVEKILIEHTSANPTGPFHMGRARNPIIGDSIARLLQYYGHNVETEYYVNDTGRQAATLAFGLSNYETKNKNKIDHELVEAYQKASKLLEENENIRDEIYRTMEEIEGGNTEVLKEVKESAKKMLEGMKISLKRLGAEANNYYHESDLIANGKVGEVIESLKNSEICKNENGAYYLDLEKENIAGRNQKFFFTRKNGLSLYTTRDIAYHLHKFQNYDKALNVLGEDHRLQSKLLGIALRELDSKEPIGLFYSFVNLPGGKMSTRAGRVVYLDNVMEMIVELAKNKLDETELNKETKERLAEDIGIGSLRYNILKVQAEKGFTFNIEDALNLQGDSAPFAMYSHARAAAIIRNYNKNIPDIILNEKLSHSEIRLLRTLAKWPDTVQRAVSNLSIHYIPNYTHELASNFNQFYRDCPVIGNNNEQLRINLVSSSKRILNTSLDILGVKAPDIM
ncbi:MAG: arginine--tRNA ligase [Candidatus Poseidoniia archaeon]|nr:arginine--tRNA ligase [Candidatus Poseidoniia archaeon]